MPWKKIKTITNEKQLNSYKHHGFWQQWIRSGKEQFLKICTINKFGLHGR